MNTNKSNRPFTPPYSSHSTRDQRLQIQTLYDAGHTYDEIHQQLSNLTRPQIKYAIRNRLTPKKHIGQHSIVTEEELEQIIAWICVSTANQRTSWIQISLIMKMYSYQMICYSKCFTKSRFYTSSCPPQAIYFRKKSTSTFIMDQ